MSATDEELLAALPLREELAAEAGKSARLASHHAERAARLSALLRSVDTVALVHKGVPLDVRESAGGGLNLYRAGSNADWRMAEVYPNCREQGRWGVFVRGHFPEGNGTLLVGNGYLSRDEAKAVAADWLTCSLGATDFVRSRRGVTL